MKKQLFIILTSTALYSFLFYEQSFGLNFFLFTCCLIAGLALSDRSLLQSTKWKIVALGSLLTGVCMLLHGNYLCFWANVASLSVLSGYSLSRETSVVTALLNSFYSYITAGIFYIVRLFRIKSSQSEKAKVLQYTVIVIISLIITSYFTALYASSNQVFSNLIARINLDFISFKWISFTFLGFLFVAAFYRHSQIGKLTNSDLTTPNTINPGDDFSGDLFNMLLSTQAENFSGVVLLSLLNIVILVVNIIDASLFLNPAPFKDSSLCNMVHQGVDSLIFSILCAILIIMYYFRGRLNFYEGNKVLKFLAYAWVLQNTFMVFTTLGKNSLYISHFQLTYKRIGVYFYLGMTFIGLVTTLIKIARAKTNWYLFRKNSWAGYAILIAAAFINWDSLITKYNLTHAAAFNSSVDIMHLINLSDANIPDLIEYSGSDSIIIDNQLRSQYQPTPVDSSSSVRPGIPSNKEILDFYLKAKISSFTQRKSEYDWRSWNYDDYKVSESIDKYQKTNK